MNELLREGIVTKLKEFNAYIDNELPDYIMVMLANNKTVAQVNQDLQLFLGQNTNNFTSWLQEVMVTPSLLKNTGEEAREKDKGGGEGVVGDVTRGGARSSEKSGDGGGVEEEGPVGMGTERRRRSGGKGGAPRPRDAAGGEDGGRREDGRRGEGVEVVNRVRSRKRTKEEELRLEKAESVDEDFRPPSPKYSKMRSDRRERDREAEDMWRQRERRRSPEGRVRGGARKAIRAQPDSTRDQDLRDHIRGGPRQKEVESSLRRREAHRGHGDKRKRAASEEMDAEVPEEMMEEEEALEEGPSTTVASVVRLVDSTRPRRTHDGGSRLLHRAILGLQPQKGSRAMPTSHSKREKVLLVPTSVLGDTPPSSIVLTKKLLPSSASRQDISSTHSDHSDQSDGQLEDEEIVVRVGQKEAFQDELQALENDEERTILQDEAEDTIMRQRLFDVAKIDRTSPSPTMGHRIKVVTSTRSSGGSRAVEKGDGLQEPQEQRLDLRTVINRSREEKTEGQSPRFVVTLDGLSMPTETLKISPVATETTPRKSVKERLGTRVRGVATPHVPASTVTGEEENKEEEGEEQATPTGVGDLPEKCRFWPNCKNGTKCPYHHPTIPCKLFPDCKYGKKCLFLHPTCKFDARCTRPDCPYLHTAPRHLSVQQPRMVSQVIPAPIAVPSPIFRPPPVFSSSYSYGGSSPSPRSRSFRYPSKSSLSWKPPQTTTSERKFAVPEDKTTSLPV